MAGSADSRIKAEFGLTLSEDQRSEPLLCFVRIVRSATQLDVRWVRLPTVRVRDDVVVFQEACLAASTGCADKGAPAGIARPDGTLHG
jgi:hypothetical protein